MNEIIKIDATKIQRLFLTFAKHIRLKYSKTGIFYDQFPAMQTHEKILSLRMQRRWKEAYIAERIGITQSYYSKIETGKVNLKEEMKHKILEGFNADFDKFEQWDGVSVFTFNDQKGGHAGQFHTTNDPEAIVKAMDANAKVYERTIEILEKTVEAKDKEIERLWVLLCAKN